MDLASHSPASTRRRSRRLSTELWVQVVGVHPELVPRRGNVGMTGVYVATSDPVGSPGDLVMLGLASVDRLREVRTLARIARLVRQDDGLRGSRIIGAAFEFLPLTRTPDGIADLVAHAAELELSTFGSLRFDETVPITLRRGRLDYPAELRSVGEDSLKIALLSDFAPLGVGDRVEVRCDWLREEEGAVVGEVVQATTDAMISLIPASVRGEAMSLPPRAQNVCVRTTDSGETLVWLTQQLLLAAACDLRSSQAQDFSGQIQRLPLSHVVSLLQREGYSGVFAAGNETRFFSFEVTQGEFRNCERPGDVAQDDALDQLLLLSKGEFKFRNKRSTSADSWVLLDGRLVQEVLTRPKIDPKIDVQ